MNPLTRRRAERRRLADWAARAHRIPPGDAPTTVEGDFGTGDASPAPVRRLPFELLEPAGVPVRTSPNGNGVGEPAEPAAVALVQSAPGGNGHGADAPVEQLEPAVATATVEPESAAPDVADPPGVGDPANVGDPPEVGGPPEAVQPPKTVEPLQVRAPEAAAPALPDPAAQTAAVLQAARKALDGRDLQLAGQLYREVLEQDPRDIRARNGLAQVLDAGGEHEAALAQLDRCRAQDESNLEVLITRCGVLGTLGRYAEAERGLRAALEREPGNAAAHFHLGLVASRRGRWREAAPFFRQATALDPNLACAHFYLGEALNHMDDLPGALQAYQRAVELSPKNPKVWYGMGIVLDRMNRPDDAAQQYRRSRELQGK